MLAQGGGLVGGLICVLIAGFGIGVPIGAVILRASVGLANKFLGRNSQGYTETLSEQSDSDPSNPYGVGSYGVASGGSYEDAIPEPSFGKACGIVLANLVVGFVAGLFVGFAIAAAGLPAALAGVVNFGVGFGISVLLYQAMLPTTTGRAAFVGVCQYLIMLLIAIVIVAVLVAVGGVANVIG